MPVSQFVEVFVQRLDTNLADVASTSNSPFHAFTVEWALSGINVYFFTRNSIPADITNGSPNPAGWGTPIANFPSTNCNPYQYFYDHFNIFDTTFCGDWAGASSVWDWAGYAGQSQSCASMTGYSTCADYVLNNGAAFSQAYWEVS